MSVPVIRRRLPLLVLAATLGVAAAACDAGDGRELNPAGPDQTASLVNPTTTSTTVAVDSSAVTGGPGEGVGEAGLVLKAPWDDEGVIDVRYTCQADGGKPGTGVSPALQWSGVPAGTSNLAILVTDLNANSFVHWIVVGIDPATTGVAEGAVPQGGIVGKNGFGTVGWGGPCPPANSEHEYLFQVYALNRDLGLTPGFDPAAVPDEIESASSAAVSLVGRVVGAPVAATTVVPTTPTTPAPTVTPGPGPG